MPDNKYGKSTNLPGGDLSKFAIQVTRKRLLDIHNIKDLMGGGK
jgi:hypothetical protein